MKNEDFFFSFFWLTILYLSLIADTVYATYSVPVTQFKFLVEFHSPFYADLFD